MKKSLSLMMKRMKVGFLHTSFCSVVEGLKFLQGGARDLNMNTCVFRALELGHVDRRGTRGRLRGRGT